MDFDFGLTVRRCREGLGLLGRDGRVARDHRRSDATQGFDGQGERRDVEEQQIFHLAGEYTGLDGGADGNDFIGVDALVALFAEEVFDELLNARHTGLAADEDDLVDLAGIDAGIGKGLLRRLHGALDDVLHKLLELGASELADQVLRTGSIRRDEGQVDLGFDRGRKLDLGALGGVAKALKSHFVPACAEVEAFVFLELIDQPVDNALVDVIATQVRIAVSGLDFDDAFADFEDGNVEGAAAKVIDGYGFVLLFVEAVSKRGRGGLIDDALDVETGDPAGVLGGLALRVVEIGRHSDHSFRDRGAQMVFRGLLQLLQNESGDFRRRVELALRLDSDVVALLDDFVGDHLHLVADFVEAATHEALDGINGIGGIGDGLALGDLADQTLAGFRERDDGRRGSPTLFVRDHFGLTALHNGDDRVGRAEIDADNLCHGFGCS